MAMVSTCTIPRLMNGYGNLTVRKLKISEKSMVQFLFAKIHVHMSLFVNNNLCIVIIEVMDPVFYQLWRWSWQMPVRSHIKPVKRVQD